MKTLKLVLSVVALLILTAIVAFAADPAATAVVAPALPDVTFFQWLTANEKPILRFALALSEFLGIFSLFKGNGLLDTIVKGLKALDARTPSAPPADEP